MKHPHDMVLTAARAGQLIQATGLAEIGQYVCRQVQADGGFGGRAPGSDLYYTVFGLACLAALNRPVPEVQVVRYLEAIGEGASLDFVHLASGARCWAALAGPVAAARGRLFLQRMEKYRARDGGYHHLVRGAAQGTVYGGFLACLAYEELGEALPEPGPLWAGMQALRTREGGYANEAGLAMSSTTATAAALLLQKWITGQVEQSAVQALQACGCKAGGYLAFAGAPGPDLLSTATALYALRQAGHFPVSATHHEEFVESLWAENGGFCGHPADPVTDCEYTFYALLALGACTETGKGA